MLYLFRHGIAEDYADSGSDADRALTPEGVHRTRLTAAGLAVVARPPARLIASPKLRALQTAEILAERFGVAVEQEPLIADGTPVQLLEWIGSQASGPGDLMLVGHEPTLSMAVQLLVSGVATGGVEMKKAGCAALELQPGSRRGMPAATLLWLAPPRLLRALAPDDVT